MLEKNFNELDRDFIITWSNFMAQSAGDLFYLGINFYKPDTVKAITRLAELGQINAVQSYYNMGLDSNNIEVKKRIDEIEQKYSKYEKDNIIANHQQKNFAKPKQLIDVANYLNFNEAFALYSYYNNLYEKGIKSRKFSKVNIDDNIKTYRNNKDKYYKLTCELAQREYAETNDWHILERMNEMFLQKRPKGYVARHFVRNQIMSNMSKNKILEGKFDFNSDEQLLDAFTMAKNVYFFKPGIEEVISLESDRNNPFYKRAARPVFQAIEILGQISNLPLSKNMDGIKLDYIHTQKDEDEEFNRMIKYFKENNISSPWVERWPGENKDNTLGVLKNKNNVELMNKLDEEVNPASLVDNKDTKTSDENIKDDGMGGEGK